MVDLNKLKSDLENGVNKDTISFNKTGWHYVASFTLDLRCKEDPQILNTSYVTISHDISSDCYFSECVQNATPRDFIHMEELKNLEERVYQLTFGVVAKGDSYWTDCGYEYDAWEEYELLGLYVYKDDEIQFIDKVIESGDGDLYFQLESE